MLQKNDYIFTPEMRDDLRRYLNGEETLGHYVPNLIFTPQLDQTADADQDQQPQPDGYYYQAAGEEPPPARKRRWWNNAEVNLMLFVLAGFVVILALCPVW